MTTTKRFGQYRINDVIEIESDQEFNLSSVNSIANTSVTSAFIEVNSNLEKVQRAAAASLFTGGQINQIVVTNESAFYYYIEDGLISYDPYPDLKTALSVNKSFSGTVSFIEPMEWNSSRFDNIRTTLPTMYLSNRKLTFDLNGNTMSSTLGYMMFITDNSDITVKNGSIFINSTSGQKGFVLANGGKLRCEDLKIDMVDNGSTYIMPFQTTFRDIYTGYTKDHLGTTWHYDYNASGSVSSVTKISDGGDPVSNCQIYVDRFCEVTLKNAKNGYDMGFWIFAPYDLCRVLGDKTRTYSNGLNLSALAPYVYVDGKVRLEANKEFEESDTKLTEALYGTYGIGNDSIGWTFEVGPNGEMNIPHGHGIYSAAQNNKVIVNGGRVIGYNGITIRGGHLEITENSNPTIIGNGDYAKYNPCHASGSAGSSIFLGHSVMIEACAAENSGYGLATADIKSGTFISKNNTSIASVAAAKSPAKWATDQSQYNRYTKFVKGGMMNRTPSIDAYNVVDNTDISAVYATNTDYDIIADGYTTSIPSMIIKEDVLVA